MRLRGRIVIGVGFLFACGSPGGGDGTDGATTSTTNPATGSVATSSTPPPTSNSTSSSASASTDSTVSTGPDPATGSSTTAEATDTDEGPIVPPCPYDEIPGSPEFGLQLVADGFNNPLLAIGLPTEPDRLLVLEKRGRIKLLEPGATTAPEDDFLEIEDLVTASGEQGLLGLAFHPDFPDDPRIYLNYTAEPDGRTRIVEYAIPKDDPDHADADSARVVLELFQPGSNHNAGMLDFGPGEQLIIGMGDGGSSSTSRDTMVLQGNFLRIGVEPDGMPDNPLSCDGCETFGPFDYTIPADNPFVGDAGYAPEIWAVGFRNPWRWAFDRQTWDLYAGDVGAGDWEEVDLVAGGRDYGWNDMEGNNCRADSNCDTSAGPNEENAQGLVAPLVEFNQDSDPGGCAVVGGAVYRSCEVPDWDGVYVYSDYCQQDIRAVIWDGAEREDLGVVYPTIERIQGNGFNAWGDVYFTTAFPSDAVYRLAPASR